MPAEQFWNWFSENNAKFLFLNTVDPQEKERLLDEFMEHLHRYSDKLFFEIGGHPDQDQELIVTAEGNKEYFDKVEELVNQAPQIQNWKVLAFKPPMPGYKIEYKGLRFDPNCIWFLPLESKSSPKDLGLRVAFSDFDIEKEKDFLSGTYLIIDNELGEKRAVLDIQHIEVDQIPDDPEENGYMKLTELTDYINWRKERKGLN